MSMIDHIRLEFDSMYARWDASVRWTAPNQTIVRRATGATPNEAVYKLKQNLEKVIREHRAALEYFGDKEITLKLF